MFNKSIPDTIKVIFLSSALVIISFLLQYNIGLNLADEGYLWYGAIETASGQIPIRDFESYDPGRYYWAASWMLLFGKDIISLRLSLAIFQTIGLTFGLLALRRVIRSWRVLFIAGLILLMWMIPRHKTFEASLAMTSVYFAVCLIENPSLRQHFISGIFVGISAFFGRNHGMYNLLAFSSLILFIRFRLQKTGLIKHTAVWAGGILLSYSPMLIMMLMVPGFFDSFLASFVLLLKRGSTTMPLPIPWPWRFNYSRMTILQALFSLSTGSFFLILPLFYAFIIIYLLISPVERLREKTLLIASASVGVFYMYYAFARADLGHLAHGIPPLLIGMLALPFALNVNSRKMLCSTGLIIILFMTIFSAGTQNWCYLKATAPGIFIKSNIAGDVLWIPLWDAQYIEAVEHINSRLISPEEGLLFIPWRPTMYPILRRKSPLRELCFLDPQTETGQKQMIEQLEQKKVNWIVLDNYALDGREEMRFSNTHKLLWKYFQEHYDLIKVRGLHTGEILLHRRP
jgi:hypothetical protein